MTVVVNSLSKMESAPLVDDSRMIHLQSEKKKENDETCSSSSSSSGSGSGTVQYDSAVEKKNIFSSNLLEQSKLHVSFLRTLHGAGVTLKRPTTESLRRYSQLWLPFVFKAYLARNNNDDVVKDLIPPPDIAWLVRTTRFHFFFTFNNFSTLNLFSPYFLFHALDVIFFYTVVALPSIGSLPILPVYPRDLPT